MKGYKIIWQKDPDWSECQYGDKEISKNTIGRYGCLLCDILMGYYFYTQEFITPNIMNDMLIENNGFFKNTLINHSIISNILKNYWFDSFTNDIASKDCIMPSPIKVKYVEGNKWGYHWILGVEKIIVKRKLIDIKIIDPYYSDLLNLSNRYVYNNDTLENSIYNIASYKGNKTYQENLWANIDTKKMFGFVKRLIGRFDTLNE